MGLFFFEVKIRFAKFEYQDSVLPIIHQLKLTMVSKNKIMVDNRISFSLSAEEKNQVDVALSTLRTVLMPKLVTLAVADRQEMPRMGDKTLSFVEKSLEYCRQEPQLYASLVDVPEFDTDVMGYVTLRGLYSQLETIVSAVDDSMMLSGSEAYNAALVSYSMLKNASRTNYPGAKEKVAELSNRFPRGKREKTPKAADSQK